MLLRGFQSWVCAPSDVTSLATTPVRRQAQYCAAGEDPTGPIEAIGEPAALPEKLARERETTWIDRTADLVEVRCYLGIGLLDVIRWLGLVVHHRQDQSLLVDQGRGRAVRRGNDCLDLEVPRNVGERLDHPGKDMLDIDMKIGPAIQRPVLRLPGVDDLIPLLGDRKQFHMRLADIKHYHHRLALASPHHPSRLRQVKRSNAPALAMHGEEDAIVPIEGRSAVRCSVGSCLPSSTSLPPRH